ncbi:MAG: AAA family ATPase [Deltaproteobacteria bacterium]|nr:AAA family ATPase [Deltaproteobacteria bacterium]
MAKADTDKYLLSPEQVRWICDPAAFDFQTTEDLKPLDGVIGQKRAGEALDLGIHLRAPGFHVFASGVAGTGKLSTVRRALGRLPRSPVKPQDILYVFDFKNPKEPRAVKLEAGKGRRLVKDMRQFVSELAELVPNMFDNKELKSKRDAIVESYKEKQKKIFRDLESDIRKSEFAMVQIQIGSMVRPAILPMIEEQPMAFEQLEQLAANGNFPERKLDELRQRHQQLTGRLEGAMKEARLLDRQLKDAVKKLEQDLAGAILDGWLAELREKYPDESLQEYFSDMREYTLENLARFKNRGDRDGENIPAAMMQMMGAPEDEFIEWQVNLLVDNARTNGPAVIMENTPTYKNLFGTIEKNGNAHRQLDDGFHEDPRGQHSPRGRRLHRV